MICVVNRYSNGLEACHGGDEVEVIMLRVLPGRSLRLEGRQMGVKPTRGYHSHSSPNHLEWFIFDHSHCLPTHILRVRIFENTRTASDDDGHLILHSH